MIKYFLTLVSILSFSTLFAQYEYSGDYGISGRLGIRVPNPNFLIDASTSSSGYDGIQLLNGGNGKWVRLYSQNLDVGSYNNSTKAGDAGIFFGTMSGINTADFGFIIAPHRSNYGGIRISSTGDVSIGVTDPDAKLTVRGVVHAQEVRVDLNGSVAPDYVFEKDYKLMPLHELEEYLNENKHLPEVPSAKEFEANGIYLKDMNVLLLKKVEELTLHLIELEKKNRRLEEENASQEQRLLQLENKKR